MAAPPFASIQPGGVPARSTKSPTAASAGAWNLKVRQGLAPGGVDAEAEAAGRVHQNEDPTSCHDHASGHREAVRDVDTAGDLRRAVHPGQRSHPVRAIRALPLASKAIPAIHGSAFPSLGSAWTSDPKPEASGWSGRPLRGRRRSGRSRRRSRAGRRARWPAGRVSRRMWCPRWGCWTTSPWPRCSGTGRSARPTRRRGTRRRRAPGPKRGRRRARKGRTVRALAIACGEAIGVGRAPAIEPGRSVTARSASEVPSEMGTASIRPSGDHQRCWRAETAWSDAWLASTRRLVDDRSSSVVVQSAATMRRTAPVESTTSHEPAGDGTCHSPLPTTALAEAPERRLSISNVAPAW